MLTLDDDVFSVIRNRDVVFRYAAYGSFAASDGLEVQGRVVSTSTVEDLIAVEFERQGEIYRVNIDDPDDATTPYGSLGAMPDVGANVGHNAITVAPNGDFIVMAVNGVNNVGMIWRINPSDIDDLTGDYGSVGTVYIRGGSAINFVGMALDTNGDLLAHDSNELFRISLTNPSIDSGIYGKIGDMPSGINAQGIDIDSNGDVWVASADAIRNHLWKINPASPGSTSGGYGNQGELTMTGATPLRGLAVLNNDDIMVVNQGGQIYRINPADITDTTGDYGQAMSAPSGITMPFGMTAVMREVQNFGAWTNIATLPASTYPAGNLSAGDTDTDVEGDDYTVAADGGWRDFTVSIPNTYDEIRVRPNLNALGNAARRDMALHSIRSA